MTYITPSLIISKEWKRLVVVAALTSFVTMSTPVRTIAAEVMVPELNPVHADLKSSGSKPVFTVPTIPEAPKLSAPMSPAATERVSKAQVSETAFIPDQVREETTGYKVVRVYNNVPSTAYTSRPEETDDSPFIAADGTHVYDGMVAANFLKFGTKIRIPELYGDKIFTVHDRMNKRYNVKVDIWMTNLKDAYKHGLRHITVEIVEPVTETTIAQK